MGYKFSYRLYIPKSVFPSHETLTICPLRGSLLYALYVVPYYIPSMWFFTMYPSHETLTIYPLCGSLLCTLLTRPLLCTLLTTPLLYTPQSDTLTVYPSIRHPYCIPSTRDPSPKSLIQSLIECLYRY